MSGEQSVSLLAPKFQRTFLLCLSVPPWRDPWLISPFPVPHPKFVLIRGTTFRASEQQFSGIHIVAGLGSQFV
jgi:hypothetical protein